MVERLTLLPAGRCLIDRSVLEPSRPMGEILDTPIWMYLVHATDGVFLVDTGMPPEALGNPGYFDGTEDEGLILPQMRPEDEVQAVLGRRGLGLKDISAVISTHWHFDHAGGNRRFPDTPILVHPQEIEAAKAGAYPPECKDMSLNYRFVSDGEEPVPGLTLLHTPGHTPGHLSVLVRRRDGPVLLAVDAVYTRANWDDGAPGAAWDLEAGRASVTRLKALSRETGAPVFFGHDHVQEKEPEWQALQR